MKKIGTLCDAHSAMWQRWAGWPDGWGPGNPLPAGITAEAAKQERLAIRKSCADGIGCDDSPELGAEEEAENLTLINRGTGAVEVHRRGCRDVRRDAHGASVWDVLAHTERDCVLDVYPPSDFDYDPADWADFNDLKYAPCTKGLLS